VTVRGADGKQLSNAPPVHLEIVSGAGQFPTGRSIDFAEDSDIAIRDGEAAIEMRSYFSGTIVVRATSPGLAPALLRVNAVGGPEFVPGVTPVAAARPYVRPSTTSAPQLDVSVDLSLNRPTDASSSAAGHSSRLANDGDAATFWQPGQEGRSWWQVDLEGRCKLSSVNILFGGGSATAYTLQISDDGVTWTTLQGRRLANGQTRERMEEMPEDAKGRFLKIEFAAAPGNAPVRLAEVKVLGHPL
jgi:hypothetical protein